MHVYVHVYFFFIIFDSITNYLCEGTTDHFPLNPREKRQQVANVRPYPWDMVDHRTILGSFYESWSKKWLRTTVLGSRKPACLFSLLL